MSKVKLSLTCGDYEIVRPLKEGRVWATGIDLNMLCDTSSRPAMAAAMGRG